MQIVKTLPTTLKSPFYADDTSLIVQALVDSQGNAVAIADFLEWFVVVIKQGDSVEIVQCDDITQNDDGSATIDVKTNGRNILPKSPYTGAATGLDFSTGAEVITTNDPLTMSRYANLDVQAVFDVVPQSTADPVDDDDLVRLSYLLDNLPGGAVSVNRTVVSGVAGEDLSAGDLVYMETDGRWYHTDADDSTTIIGTKIGTAQGDATTNIAIPGGVLVGGKDPNNSGYSAGALLYAGNTAGAIVEAAGTTSRVIGIADEAGDLILDPYFNSTLTSGQVDALAAGGAFGTPGSANKFITEQKFNPSGTVDQSQTTQNGSITVGEADATTKKKIIAQSFVPTVSSMSGVKLWKAADTGSFTGTVKVALQANSAGNPSGSDLASFTISNAAWLKLTAAAEIGIAFSTEYSSLVIGDLYWIVVTPSTTDNSNHPNLGINTAGGYASGTLKYNNVTDGWVSVATSILYFKDIPGILGKVPKTDTTSGLLPEPMRGYSFVAMDLGGGTITSNVALAMFSKLLYGGFFGLNTGVKVRVYGTYNNQSSATDSRLIVTINLNGTTVGAQVLSQSVNNSSTGVNEVKFVAEFIILNNNSLSAQKVLSHLISGPSIVGGGTITPTGLDPTNTFDSNQATPAIDTSMPILLEVMFNLTANTGTGTFNGVTIEKIG